MKKLALLISILATAACGGDEVEDPEDSTPDNELMEPDADHDMEGAGHGGENCVAEVKAVTMIETPAITQTAGTAFDVSFKVENNTGDDLHVTQVRYCVGADVEDCGLGSDQDAFTVVAGEESATDCTFDASVIIDTPGTYTLVAYAHIGLGEQGANRSEAINIEVAAP